MINGFSRNLGGLGRYFVVAEAPDFVRDMSVGLN